MNYIKRLEKENTLMKQTLTEMYDYANSSKFNWPEEGINKRDITGRITNLWDHGISIHDCKEKT